MGWRFRRSVELLPGVRLNLTKTGYGVTFGPRGLHYTVHSSGRHTRSVGLPGTGLYWTDSSYPGQTASTAPLDSRTTRVVDAARIADLSGLQQAGTAERKELALVAQALAVFLRIEQYDRPLARSPVPASAHCRREVRRATD